MRIGVPREIKNHEYRIGLVPSTVRELCSRGHEVFIENDAGKAIGLTNDRYESAGAEIVPDAATVFERSQMIVKVKEPQANERVMLRDNHVLFTYLHLAPDPAQTRDLVECGATCIAYETVTDNLGRLPLLAPRSEV